jgi:hypothetical protein
LQSLKSNNIESIDSTNVVLTWSYNLNTLRTINKQLSLPINEHDNVIIQSNIIQKKLNKKLTDEDLGILKNLYFEIYLVYKVSKSPLSQPVQNLRRLIKPFRTLSAIQLLIHENKESRIKRNLQDALTFVYNLTNLTPNTKYSFEISARLFNLESFLSNPLKLASLRKNFYIYKHFIRELF